MSVEAKRGCGYRKIGGTYLAGGGIGRACDRLPLLVERCPTCSHGIKPARGWTWVDVGTLVQGPHILHFQKMIEELGVIDDTPDQFCKENESCVFCGKPEKIGRAGLLWISEKFYSTPEEFIAEGFALGFSRRIAMVPRGFKVGETYVLLGHRKAVSVIVSDGPQDSSELFPKVVEKFVSGIFYLWRPQKIERIMPDTATPEEIKAVEKRGLTPVLVPADDPDHAGVAFSRQKTLFAEEI